MCMHIYLGKSAHEASFADTRISYEYNFKEKFVILHHIRTVLRLETLCKTNEASASTTRTISASVHCNDGLKFYNVLLSNEIHFFPLTLMKTVHDTIRYSLFLRFTEYTMFHFYKINTETST